MSEQTDEMQVCYKHKDRKTLLRCNKCGRPICLECAVQTPTGYRCKDCIREQQKVFDTSEGKDFVIGALIAAVLGLLGSYADRVIPLASFLTELITGILIGQLICTLVRAAVQKRRSKNLNIVITIAAGVGAALPRLQQALLILKALFLGQYRFLLGGTLELGLGALYIFVLCLTIWSNMNGMVFRR